MLATEISFEPEAFMTTISIPEPRYQLTNQHEIGHRPTQTDTDKGRQKIHKKS